MSFTIDGLTNANTFYSQHYLDDILEKDLKSLFERWKAQGNQSPAARLKAAGGANGYFRNRERFLAAKSPESRAQHLQALAAPILEALDYAVHPQNLPLAAMTGGDGGLGAPVTLKSVDGDSAELPPWVAVTLML